MVENSELLRVPAFADLPDDQITWFLSQAQELHFKPGEGYSRQGDPADAMFVILEGQVEIRGEIRRRNCRILRWRRATSPERFRFRE